MPIMGYSDIQDMFDGQDKIIFSDKEFVDHHASNKSKEIHGTFLKDYIDISGVESYSPLFDCATLDVKNVKHGAICSVFVNQDFCGEEICSDSEDFMVVGVMPDGHGITRLVLEST